MCVLGGLQRFTKARTLRCAIISSKQGGGSVFSIDSLCPWWSLPTTRVQIRLAQIPSSNLSFIVFDAFLVLVVMASWRSTWWRMMQGGITWYSVMLSLFLLVFGVAILGLVLSLNCWGLILSRFGLIWKVSWHTHLWLESLEPRVPNFPSLFSS